MAPQRDNEENFSKGPTQRMLQVGEEMRHVLASLLRHYQPFPDQTKEISITISEVRMSPDLKHATIFVMPLGASKEAEVILQSLKKNAPSLRHRLAGKLPFKFLPTLRFHLDESIERAKRIEELLRESR